MRPSRVTVSPSSAPGNWSESTRSARHTAHRNPSARNAAIRSLGTAMAASPTTAKGAYQISGNPVSCWASRIPARKLRAPERTSRLP